MGINYGVALMVPSDVIEGVESFLSQVKKLNIPLVFEAEGFLIPHITLYQGCFLSDVRAKEAWRALLKKNLKFQCDYRIEMSKVVEVRKNNNIFWNVIQNPQLTDLHVCVAGHMQMFTDGLLTEQTQAVMMYSTEDEIDRILKFGSVATGDMYYPHVTLGRLTNSEDQKYLCQMNRSAYPFTPAVLCFGPINKFGQMDFRLLETFKL